MGTGDAMGTAAGSAMGRSCTFACPIEPHETLLWLYSQKKLPQPKELPSP